jgi:hypothetical protein
VRSGRRLAASVAPSTFRRFLFSFDPSIFPVALRPAERANGSPSAANPSR